MEDSAVHNDIHSTCLPGKSDLIIGMLASVWRDGSHPKAGACPLGIITHNPSQNKTHDHHRGKE